MEKAEKTINETEIIETSVSTGVSMPRRSSITNSIYEQLNRNGSVKSRAFYDEKGRLFSRQDFDHEHFIKSAGKTEMPHEYNYSYNKFGQPNGKNTNPLPSGYTNLPSIGRDKL